MSTVTIKCQAVLTHYLAQSSHCSCYCTPAATATPHTQQCSRNTRTVDFLLNNPFISFSSIKIVSQNLTLSLNFKDVP